MPRKSQVRLDQESEVLKILEEGALSIDAITERSGFQHYTIRRVLKDLQAEGTVKVVGFVERHRVYGLAKDPKDINRTIPSLVDIVNRMTIKAIYLIEYAGKEDQMRSTKAAKNLFKYMTILMDTANYASHGQDVRFRLDSMRAEMQKDFVTLKNLYGMYEQVLQEPKFWNSEYLAKMTDDPDYNFNVIQQAMDYYDSLPVGKDE